MPDLLTDKVLDKEIRFSFDRRVHDIEELKALFDLIGYEVRTHGCEKKAIKTISSLSP